MPIARIKAVNGGFASGLTRSWSHRVDGPNSLLVAVGRVDSITATITATYNGLPMTSAGQFIDAGDGFTAYMFYITGQNGTHNIVVTSSVSVTITGNSMSYSGVAQNGAGYVSGSGSLAPAGLLSAVTGNLITQFNGDWMVMWVHDSTGTTVYTGFNGAFTEINDGSGVILSKGPVVPGYNSIQANINKSVSTAVYIYMAFSAADSFNRYLNPDSVFNLT